MDIFKTTAISAHKIADFVVTLNPESKYAHFISSTPKISLNFLYSLAYICHHFTAEYLKLNQTILPVVYDFLLTTFPLNNLMIFCKRRSSVASRSSNRGCVAVFLLSLEEKIRV